MSLPDIGLVSGLAANDAVFALFESSFLAPILREAAVAAAGATLMPDAALASPSLRSDFVNNGIKSMLRPMQTLRMAEIIYS